MGERKDARSVDLFFSVAILSVWIGSVKKIKKNIT